MPSENKSVMLSAKAVKDLANLPKTHQDKFTRFLKKLLQDELESNVQPLKGFPNHRIFRYGGDLRVIVRKTSIGYSIVKISVKKGT